MITLENLVTGYQGQPLTQPLSGCFKRGSLTAIVGANGSGKSTLLRTLAGLQPPVTGRVQCDSPLLGWLPQRSELDRHFPITVSDVVAMGCWPATGLLRGLGSAGQQRINEALEQVGLIEMAHSAIARLSGGQFQRMLFARLLVQDAPLMLLDEPFTGIDSQTCDALLAIIATLHRQGKTLLVVLHSQRIVQQWFPETLWIHEGHYHWGQTRQAFAQLAATELEPDLLNCSALEA